MHTTQELTAILGLSRKQLRTRLDALARAGLLEDHQVKTGPHGRQVFEHGVLVTLRELEQLARNGGHQLPTAAQELAHRIRGNGQEPADTDCPPMGQRAQLDARDALISELRARVAHLEGEVSFLRGLVNDRPALPASVTHSPLKRLWKGIFAGRS